MSASILGSHLAQGHGEVRLPVLALPFVPLSCQGLVATPHCTEYNVWGRRFAPQAVRCAAHSGPRSGNQFCWNLGGLLRQCSASPSSWGGLQAGVCPQRTTVNVLTRGPPTPPNLAQLLSGCHHGTLSRNVFRIAPGGPMGHRRLVPSPGACDLALHAFQGGVFAYLPPGVLGVP